MASETQSEGGFDTGTLLGVSAGVGLITIAIILGGDPDVFVNLKAISGWNGLNVLHCFPI